MDLSTRVFDSVLEMLPSEANPSPMVRINALHPLGPSGPMPRPDVTVFAKLEWFNPFGSIKDRAAWEMIRDMEERGELGPAKPGRGIVEPTSGNTGLSLAAICGVRGYSMRAVVPGKVPREKQTLLKIAGAELDVTTDAMCPLPGMEDGTIGLAKTYAKASASKYAMPNQYENPANVRAHQRTTGPEIWRQTGGRVTHVFTSLGTCGTVSGLSSFLKSKNPAVRVIAVQPSPGHDVPGIRNTSELDVSKLYDPKLIDEVLEVNFERAYGQSVQLARREGLLAGPSSGLIFAGLCDVLTRDAAKLPSDAVAVAIFCDGIFKYIGNLIKHVPELSPEEVGM